MARRERRRQSADSYGEVVRERSSLLLPGALIIAVLLFSSAFLYYYFGPTVDELLGRSPVATSSGTEVDITISGERYLIPANYTRYAQARAGGTQESVELHTLLPTFEPFSQDKSEKFNYLGPGSRVVHFSLGPIGDILAAERRFNVIYVPQMSSTEARPGSWNLTLYEFNERSAYRNQDLFTFNDSAGRLGLLMCDKVRDNAPSPTCSRFMHLNDKVVFRYRYKRAFLKRWREIDGRLLALVGSFRLATISGRDDD